ncbi:MAG: thioredoxin [Candidatus Altiarchaeota archaeon]
MNELDELRQKKMREILEKQEKTRGVAMDKVVEVTDDSFNDIISKNPVVVLDMWASWCGPCRMIAPIIDELAKEYAGRIVFGKLNVDENQEVPAKFNVMSIPTLLVFKDAKLVDQIVGAMPKESIEHKISRHIS